MAEAAQDIGQVIFDCVAFLYEEGKGGGGGGGGEHYRQENKFHCRVAKSKKRFVKLRERIW